MGRALIGSSVVDATKVNAERFRVSAKKIDFPKAKLPPLEDYAEACRKLIWATFRSDAGSQHGIAVAAHRETGGIQSVSAIERFLCRETKLPNAHFMNCIGVIAFHRGVEIPAALAIRLTAGDAA